MREQVKLALRITTDAFDSEIDDLIEAAIGDLKMAGVAADEHRYAPVVRRAVTTYCKAHFGQPDNYEQLKAAYDEQKAQLMVATGYTDWGKG